MLYCNSSLKHSGFSLHSGFFQPTTPPSHTPVFSGGTFKFQSMAPSSPYLSFNHALVFRKCSQSNYDNQSANHHHALIKAGTHKSLRRTQGTRMHTLQHAMPHSIQLGHPLCRRLSPRQKHHAVRPLSRYNINHLLRKFLPSMIRVAVRLVRSHRQTRVQE